MDLRVIADAIAARYVGVTVNGETFQYGPSPLVPNGIVKGPALIVMVPSGGLDDPFQRQRDDEHDFAVLWLNDPTDLPTRSALFYAWYNALQDKVYEQYRLGLSYVQWARPVSYRTAFDEQFLTLGKYDVIEWTVRVKVRETIPNMAI